MKNHIVQFTLTHTEWQVLNIVAASKGFGTIGRYAKYLAFERANARPAKGMMAQIHGLPQAEKVFSLITEGLDGNGCHRGEKSLSQAFLPLHTRV